LVDPVDLALSSKHNNDTSIQIHSGGFADSFATLQRLESDMTVGNFSFETFRYSNTSWDFSVFNSSSYSPRADARSWSAVTDLLISRLASPFKPLPGTKEPKVTEEMLSTDFMSSEPYLTAMSTAAARKYREEASLLKKEFHEAKHAHHNKHKQIKKVVKKADKLLENVRSHIESLEKLCEKVVDHRFNAEMSENKHKHQLKKRMNRSDRKCRKDVNDIFESTLKFVREVKYDRV